MNSTSYCSLVGSPLFNGHLFKNNGAIKCVRLFFVSSPNAPLLQLLIKQWRRYTISLYHKTSLTSSTDIRSGEQVVDFFSFYVSTIQYYDYYDDQLTNPLFNHHHRDHRIGWYHYNGPQIVLFSTPCQLSHCCQ